MENDIIIYANNIFLEVLDRPAEKLIGTSILEKVEGEDKLLLEEYLERIKNGAEEIFSRDVKMSEAFRKDSYFSVHLKIYAREGNCVKTIGASRNATIRVNRKTQLIETKSRFEGLYNNMVDGIIVYNYIDEKVIDHNAAALKILGYEYSEDLLNSSRYKLVPKDSHYFPGIDLHQRTKNHGIRVMNGEVFQSHGTMNKRDGKQILVSLNIVPTYINNGEAFIMFKDVTKKVLAKRAAQETEKRYRDVFDNAHEAIVYRDVKTKKPIMCNENALKLFGVKNFEEFSELTPVDFHYDTSIDGMSPNEYTQMIIKKALSEGRAETTIWIKKRTGEVILVEGVIIGDSSDSENPKVITFFRDITHLYKAEKALNEKNKELEKYINSNLQLENFAFFASHDLQTPLRSIISFTQILKSNLEGQLSVENEDYMNFIISSTKNMHTLVNDLLSYSKVNSTQISKTQINLNNLILELCLELDILIREKQANISFENLPEFIIGDETKIRMVFQNLITNAIKFSKKMYNLKS